MPRSAVLALIAAVTVVTMSCPSLLQRSTRFHVVQRLTTPIAGAPGADVAALAAGAAVRWTADEIRRDWTFVNSDTATTFRSPELQADGTLQAVVISLAPRPMPGAAPLLLWSDEPVLSDSAFARNRRALPVTVSGPRAIAIRADTMVSDTPRPIRYLFLHIEGGAQTTGSIDAVALVTDTDLAGSNGSGITRISVGPQSRDAFVRAIGQPLTFTLDVPSGAEMSFGVALSGATGRPASIRVVQLIDGRERVLLETTGTSGRWQQHRVRLTATAHAQLIFLATAADESTVYWSTPEIHAPLTPDHTPNVVLVVVDALRADVLGAYGASLGVSPFLDRLATQSSVFSRAYAAASWTKPSIATLLTSIYPQTHQLGARFYSDPLPDSLPTLQQSLAAAGFRTAQVTANPFSGALSNLDRGFDRVTLPVAAAGAGTFSIPGRTINAEAVPWLEEHARDQFFLYVHYVDTHPPFAGVAAGGGGRRAYEKAVAIADGEVARLHGALERLGLADNTIFIVTADHGEAFGEHGQTGHGQTVYEEEIRVPLIIRTPGRPTWPRLDEPVHLADVMPTILELCGVTPPADLQGRSLVAAAAGASSSQVMVTRFVYPEDLDLPKADRSDAVAVVDYPWKFIATDRQGTRSVELYDLGTDPGERRNLADAEPLRVRRLTTILEGFLRNQATARTDYLATHVPSGHVRPAAPARELQDQLRTLGYIR